MAVQAIMAVEAQADWCRLPLVASRMICHFAVGAVEAVPYKCRPRHLLIALRDVLRQG